LNANNLKPGPRRFVLHNGVEDKFKQALGGESRLKARHELIPGYRDRPGTVFVSVANFVPYKDYDTVLRAMMDLKGSYPFHYLILGDGPRRAETKRQIAEAGLEENVTLLGQRHDVETFLRISDYFIHSSKGEGISNAIVEAMMAGLPVIATRVGGIPETVFPGSSALFEYQDDRQLLEILKTIEGRFAGFDPHGEAYRKHLEEFSQQRMVERFYRIVDEIQEHRKAL
jgi:glycosyltransferase involved in cell wall biosynthesis